MTVVSAMIAILCRVSQECDECWEVFQKAVGDPIWPWRRRTAFTFNDIPDTFWCKWVHVELM